ncbi:MAG: hypothetical protein PHV43_00865 [Candidatus Colwellbacteria bacterium]|nr:hypothetical protein [Candidatus Colwellbacteria bacterium]
MSARKRSRERGRLRAVFFLMLGLLALAGGFYLVYFSNVFKIQEIEIAGSEYVEGGGLGLSPGGNILWWEPDVDLAELPKVSSLSVEKRYLERKVIITLTSRERYAIWCVTGADKCFWVDEVGFAFSEAPDLQGPLIFRLIRDNSGRELALGDRVLDSELFTNLTAAFAFLEKIDVDLQEFRIEDLKFKEAVAQIKDGPDIYFSLTLDPHFGLGVVSSLRQSGEWNVIKYLDLRVPNRAYYNG